MNAPAVRDRHPVGARTATVLRIATSELVQMSRNRLVLVSGLIIPAAVGGYFVHQHEAYSDLASSGYVSAIVTFTVMAFGLYTTAVTTLAARRQSLFLKRLRSTAAEDWEILTGLVLPITAIALAQSIAILGVLAVVSTGPAHVPLLVVAVVATTATMVGLALATAGLTTSPEHAQVTTLPVSLALVGVASWVGTSGTEDLPRLKRLLPGGSATELILNGWDGGVPLADSLPLLAPTLGWVGVAVVLAGRFFRWEPRR